MRQFQRVPIQSYGFIVDDQQTSRMIIHDFSRMGVGFISEKEIKIRSFISVLYQNDSGQTVRMKSYVKHVKRINSQQFYIGVQFVAVESKSA